MNTIDVAIIGAGLSGIAAAYYLQKYDLNLRYRILEKSTDLGGTWNIFKYPGIRSDSEMHTFGFSFEPWPHLDSIGTGEQISNYIKSTAQKYGIEENSMFSCTVKRATWTSDTATWTIYYIQDGKMNSLNAKFVLFCTGFFDTETGYTPAFEGMHKFTGEIIHPQFWPDDLDLRNKNVALIGSGATAVTLMPELADKCRKLTMIQRSPTYIFQEPALMKFVGRIRSLFPKLLSERIIRTWFIAKTHYRYLVCTKFPDFTARLLIGRARLAAGPAGAFRASFTPRYKPWEQRLCLDVDGKFFAALRTGTADLITDEIAKFSADCIHLKSGRTVEADVVITATGFNAKIFGGIDVFVDDNKLEPSQNFFFRNTLVDGVPNLSVVLGYVNASWTLRSELVAQYLCRLLGYMKSRGFDYVVARRPDRLEPEASSFQPNYLIRASDKFVRCGNLGAWRCHSNVILDNIRYRYLRLDDGNLDFRRIN